MAAKENLSKVEPLVRIHGIEVIESFHKAYPLKKDEAEVFSFNVIFEQRVHQENKLVFVILHIKIHSNAIEREVGGLVFSCVYLVENFDEVIKLNEDKVYFIPKDIELQFNNLTFSAARGAMYALFRGTYLQGAILPISDLRNLTKKPEVLNK